MPYNIVHVDNDKDYLKFFSSLIEEVNNANLGSPEKPTYSLTSFDDPNECLSFMILNDSIDLCILDLSMSKHQSLEGFGLVQTIKLFCPSANCLILTSNLAKSVVVEAAKVGCSGLIRKSTLRNHETQPAALNQIEYFCMHSRKFLKANSQDRHNFSHTIAHILKGVLFQHEIITSDSLSILLDNAANISNDFTGYGKVIENTRKLIKDHSEVGRQLEKVLQFHTKRQLDLTHCCLEEEIEKVASHPQYEGKVYFKDKTHSSEAFLDATLFRIALHNLLENSHKYSKGVPSAEEKNIEVTLDYVGRHDTYLVTVRDYGIGIPENEIEKVVYPNVYGSNAAKGLVSFGIGLSDVRKIVRLHRNKYLSGTLELKIPEDKVGNIAIIEIPKKTISE